MARVGLVLGAGGIVGQAFHAGVLEALQARTGWDPRTAEVIVGSSAGSVTGALLRLGVSSHDLAAFGRGDAPSPAGAELFAALGADELDFPPPSLSDLWRAWRPPSARLLARIARRPWAFRPSVAAMTLLPAGRVDLSPHTGALDAVAGDACADGWPDGLLVCAARRDDGARTTFGKAGSTLASLGEAVTASCAIPGYFAPVSIDGVEYFDGGVHSPTNADVLCDAALDLVVVLSPMSAAHGRGSGPDALVRFGAHRRLQREARRLRAAGTEVLCFEPGREALAAMGVNAMADDRSAEVVAAASAEATIRLQDSRLEARLSALTDAPAGAPETASSSTPARARAA